LEGQPNPVVAVASELEKGATQGLMATPPCDEQKDDASRCPFVGIVDHVVVMPLEEENINPTLLRDESGMYQLSKPAAWVACRVEKVSDQLGVGVIIMAIRTLTGHH
jgi:hypothetical protein